jgi:inhibitor of cysteine peptidase
MSIFRVELSAGGFRLFFCGLAALLAFVVLPFAAFAAGSSPGGDAELNALEVADETVLPVYEIVVGEPFSLELPGNPATGFSWEIENMPPFLSQVGEPKYEPSAEGASRVGAGGFYLWEFAATTAGEGEVSLVYRRPWEKDVAPASRFVRNVRAVLNPL